MIDQENENAAALPSSDSQKTNDDENQEIQLPSSSNMNDSGGDNQAALPGTRTSTDDKSLTPGDVTQGPVKPKPDIADPVGATLKERIKNSTRAGGLGKIPLTFKDSDGDWVSIKSDNPFENLYLDHEQYEDITPKMLKNNFDLINAFWQEIIDRMHTGATRHKIIQKYAGREGGERTILNFQKKLKQSYSQLANKNAIVATVTKMERDRIEKAEAFLDPKVNKALDDNILEPSEERILKDIALDVGFTEEEFDVYIERKLKEFDSIRGKGGSEVSQAEQGFFFLIKQDFLADKYLSLENEKRMLILSEQFAIPPLKLDGLILKALKEVDDSEREKTFEQDKKNYDEFNYELFKNYGLKEDGSLTEQAVEELRERESSDTDFFPLSRKTRQELKERVVERYNTNIGKEKKIFYDNALKELRKYDGHVEKSDALMKDEKYALLLPVMRQELIANVKSEIIEEQEREFIDRSETYFRNEHWKISGEDKEAYIILPQRLLHTRTLKTDWLSKERRTALFADVEKWAEQEYSRDRDSFRTKVKGDLKKYAFGLPVKLQKKLEADRSFCLHKDERREIIIKLEKTIREQAARSFEELVKSRLVFETLIPPVETDLKRVGTTEFILSDDKNKISHRVRTAKEIIKQHRKPFAAVIDEKVKRKAELCKLEDSIVAEYGLQYSACITPKDSEIFVNSFKPEEQEYQTVLQAFQRFASKHNLHITAKDNKNEFVRLFFDAVEKKSKKYRYRLKHWMTEDFINTMIKIGAAYGVTERDVKAKISYVKDSYKDWTLPRLKPFLIWAPVTAVLFLLLRFLFSLTGYWDWIFISGPVRHYDLHNQLAYLQWDHMFGLNANGFWIVGFVIVFVGFYILRKIVKG